MSDRPKRSVTRGVDLDLRHRLVAWRVLNLFNLTQRSGTPAYRRATGLADGQWRIVQKVGIQEPVHVGQIAALLSRDKSQISRAASRLVSRGVLTRAGRRGPLALSIKGRAIFSQIVRLAMARNIALTDGLSDAELRKLPTLLARLQTQARRFISPRFVRSATSASRQALAAALLTDREDLRARQRDAKPRDRLILPDFINFLNLLRSSAATAFGRVTGLSEVECQIVSQVAEYGILTLIELVSTMNRDKSQVGRAVKRLLGLGHLATYKIGGGRHVRLVITSSGRRIYERAARLALRRNAQLVAGLSRAQQAELFAMLDRITLNAEDLLRRQGARAAQRAVIFCPGTRDVPTPMPRVAAMRSRNSRMVFGLRPVILS